MDIDTEAGEKAPKAKPEPTKEEDEAVTIDIAKTTGREDEGANSERECGSIPGKSVDL
jgi:hypothetical protein